jgi:hypothetical protein
VPSGLALTPQTGFSVSSLDILNEEMQLTYEIANLELLLEGALSDRFIRNQRIVKPRATIGFPISLAPQPRFKNAVAVVEVDVENIKETLSDEPPAITALLPQEKTYNVAALTDRTRSIGAGVVIGTVGGSGSFFSAHRTFYLVQDQDTIAIQRPSTNEKVSFAWQFRPVLGRKFVRGGLKHTFVQLAFPTLNQDCVGTIHIRTYWRHFDQGNGLAEEVISGSVFEHQELFPVPKYDLTPFIEGVTFQDLGDGTVLVNVQGRQSFLAGTYVQLGPIRYDTSSGLRMEETGLTFTTPAAALARWTGHVISRDGNSAELLDVSIQKRLPKLNQLSCIKNNPSSGETSKVQIRNARVSTDGKSVDIEMQKDSGIDRPAHTSLVDKASQSTLDLASTAVTGMDTENPVLHAEIIPGPASNCTNGSITITKMATTSALNENDTLVGVELALNGVNEKQFNGEILLEIGHRVFGLSDTTASRDFKNGTITAVVPTSLLIAGQRLRVFRPFYTSPEGSLKTDDPNTCFNKFSDLGVGLDSAVERVVLIEVDKDGNAKYLLYGNDLAKAEVVPKGKGDLKPVGSLPEDKVRLLIVSKENLATIKKLVLQKGGNQRPLVLDLPQPESKPQSPPKVTIDSPVIQNTDELDVSVEKVDDLNSVKMGEKELKKIKGKGSIRLINLRADGVTSEQKSQELTFEYKDKTKVTVKLEVVAARVGVKQ